MERKGIIFDVDGTMWDSTEKIAESYNITLEKKGIQQTISKQQICDVMGCMEEEIAERLFPTIAYEERIPLIRLCMIEECEYLKEHTGVLYPEVERVIAELVKVYDLFIVSNCQDGYIESLFATYDLQKYFIDYECSGRTGLLKGENIRLIMERNKLEKAVYVGDTQKDKDACILANIPFIFASFGFGSVDSYDAKVDTFAELEALLLSDQ